MSISKETKVAVLIAIALPIVATITSSAQPPSPSPTPPVTLLVETSPRWHAGYEAGYAAARAAWETPCGDQLKTKTQVQMAELRNERNELRKLVAMLQTQLDELKARP